MASTSRPAGGSGDRSAAGTGGPAGLAAGSRSLRWNRADNRSGPGRCHRRLRSHRFRTRRRARAGGRPTGRADAIRRSDRRPQDQHQRRGVRRRQSRRGDDRRPVGGGQARDGIIGEEGAAAPGRRTWVIDPVDGTYNFVSGLPAWCSALALLDGADLLLGAIFQQTTDELWIGGRDHPTTLNGVPLPPLRDRALGEVAISTYLHPTRVADVPLREGVLRSIAGAASVRIIGSGSVELAAVAAGRLGVWLHADTPSWDWLPGAAVVTAAGGVVDVFDHGGHRWYVAGPPTGVAQARAAVLGSSLTGRARPIRRTLRLPAVERHVDRSPQRHR